MNDAAPQTQPIEEQPDLSEVPEVDRFGQTADEQNQPAPESDPLNEAPTRREVIDWLNSLRGAEYQKALQDQDRLDKIRSEALTFALNANAGGTAGVGNTEVIEHAEKYFAFLSGSAEAAS
jgi:hypothetical protein